MILSLKAGSKLYLNGAVIKVDRKVNLELINDAVFILDIHVMQTRDATTPLRQLYFVLQSILMEPGDTAPSKEFVLEVLAGLNATFENREVLDGLQLVGQQIAFGRSFEAMKLIRLLFSIEDQILLRHGNVSSRAA